ncbi:hypothetical protein AAFF_G00373830 [Aldrovandia affinis]|uniref:Ig-like domain-containing protein n=1 Tax=Aldrovandia affinis TaxID=143900 RepID=A0AAD7R4S0_9TELE|nr:hypothetical protein AAFF_G00373830 [Aldrovandia affinis]
MLLQRYIIFVVLSLTVQGVLGQNGWSVSYQLLRICALKGSSVDMPCTYSYPNDNTVESTFWFVEKYVDLAETPEYKGRVEYRGNKEHDCTLRVRDLRESDSKTYFFRFITDTDSYYGIGGSTLSVTDLQVEVNPATVREGQRVTLTCRTTCTLSGSPAFIWYKNKLPLSTTNLYNNYLQFTASMTLSVRYAPKSTSVSVSPSGEIVEGGSVTLTCSSNANPPVQRYTWFKKNDTGVWQTGSGQSLNVSNFRSWNSGQYYCEAENKHGVHNSTALSITTKGEKSLMVAICASAGITALVTLVLVAVTVWMCKRKKGGTPRARERGADTQACPNPDNDTYTALNLNDVSSDYDTLTACPNPDNDTYTALNRNDVSSDYDTLTSLRNAPASVYH